MTTQETAIQRKVLVFLSAPATHGDADVRRIDTHAAVVFLAGDRALKVKRAIRFPFLDYSTLAKRKASCDEESVHPHHRFTAALLPSPKAKTARSASTVTGGRSNMPSR